MTRKQNMIKTEFDRILLIARESPCLDFLPMSVGIPLSEEANELDKGGSNIFVEFCVTNLLHS